MKTSSGRFSNGGEVSQHPSGQTFDPGSEAVDVSDDAARNGTAGLDAGKERTWPVPVQPAVANSVTVKLMHRRVSIVNVLLILAKANWLSKV